MTLNCCCYVFFFNVTASTEIYTDGHTLSLHDALPIWGLGLANSGASRHGLRAGRQGRACLRPTGDGQPGAVRPAEFTAAPPWAYAARSPGTGPRTVSRPPSLPACLLKHQESKINNQKIITTQRSRLSPRDFIAHMDSTQSPKRQRAVR